MMQNIPVEPIPNQSLNVRLDGVRYVIELKEAGGMMVATIDRDGNRIVTSARCVEGAPILVHSSSFNGHGNFVLVSNAIPYYPDFGTSCFLTYITPEEISAGL
jgi:hypothetical protein